MRGQEPTRINFIALIIKKYIKNTVQMYSCFEYLNYLLKISMFCIFVSWTLFRDDDDDDDEFPQLFVFIY